MPQINCVEERRFASSIGTNKYDELRRFGQVGNLQASEPPKVGDSNRSNPQQNTSILAHFGKGQGLLSPIPLSSNGCACKRLWSSKPSVVAKVNNRSHVHRHGRSKLRNPTRAVAGMRPATALVGLRSLLRPCR